MAATRSYSTASCLWKALVILNAMQLVHCEPLGQTGKLTMLDGKTGRPRTIIDIEKAARLRTVETGNAPRFRKVACAERARSPDSLEVA